MGQQLKQGVRVSSWTCPRADLTRGNQQENHQKIIGNWTCAALWLSQDFLSSSFTYRRWHDDGPTAPTQLFSESWLWILNVWTLGHLETTYNSAQPQSRQTEHFWLCIIPRSCPPFFLGKISTMLAKQTINSSRPSLTHTSLVCWTATHTTSPSKPFKYVTTILQ